MIQKSKLFLLLGIICFGLTMSIIALAQENTTAETGDEGEKIEEVILDETVKAEDLEVKEPKLLPDSKFYFLKEWGRGIRSFFTFNKIKKAELESRYANERLVELKKMVEQNKDPEVLKKAEEKYKRTLDKIRERAEKIKEKAEESEEVEKFLDKFTRHQLLHQKILEKLEEQVPEEVFEKIKEARERHLERFGEVMAKLEARKEKIKEKLEEAFEEQKGSKYKDFKNLEVLTELEEKVPEQAKEAIRRAQENALKRLKGDLEKMSPEDQERFKEYIEKISGEKEKQLEILESLKMELKEKPELEKTMIQARERILEKIQVKTEEIDCPVLERPSPDFCVDGRIIIRKDPETDCPTEVKCIIPEEIKCTTAVTCQEEYVPRSTGKRDENGCLIMECVEETEAEERAEACITLWDPVCGKDGKTYSNRCFARLAGIEIAYKGECKERECKTDADCPQLKCGPVGTTREKCIGVRTKCLNGKCVIAPTVPPTVPPTETEPVEPRPACPTLWDPVCGKDGKTYSNECVARIAGVVVAYKGRCKEENTCNQQCKSKGYNSAICRTWAISPEVEWGCRNNELNIGRTSDCYIPIDEKGIPAVGVGKACCCQK